MKWSWSSPKPLQRLISLGLVFLFPLLGETAGLDPAIPLTSYGIDVRDSADGLSQFRIRALIQTQDGYIWLGTGSGLVRFDGVAFTTFDISTGSLVDNEVSSLVEDRSGALWIGTYGGGITRLQAGKFTSFTTADGLLDNSIRRMVLDAAGNLWLATPRGVVRLTAGKLTSFTTAQGLAENFVTAISPAAPQGVYVIAGGRLSCFVDGRFQSVEGVIEDGDGRIDSLATGRDGELWMTFESGRIKRWKEGKLSVYTASDNLPNRVGAIYEDPEGSVWFAARDKLLRLANGRFESLDMTDAQTGLGVILSFLADAEGNLWLGTEASGLARLHRVSARLLTMKDGLPENSTRCVFRDKAGDIWVGTYMGYARLRGDAVSVFTRMGSNAIPAVTALGEDRHGTLWLAMGGQLYTRDQDELRPVPGWKKVFDIKVITPDHNGHIWVGTDGKGVYEIADGVIKHLGTDDGLANNQIRAILNDREGAVWVGTSGGLSRIKDGKITNFHTSDGLASERVMSLHEDSEGVLWISTRSGLSRRANGKFFNYLGPEGLPDSFIYNVLDDQRGGFWLSTGKGIFRVGRASLNAMANGPTRKLDVTSVTYREGLRSAALVAGTQPNAALAPDGRLLFCSLKGLVAVDPQARSVNSRPPPVRIEALKINQQICSTGQLLTIPPGAGEVEVKYTALSYVAPENVRFKYKLEGYDTSWVDAGIRRFAHYASLPPGDYCFRVLACNNDGVWSETGASCSFQLLPHVYQRAWFWPLIVVLAGCVAGALVLLRLRAHRQHAKELQQRIDEAVARVRVLSGLLPICSGCKKVRDDGGYWSQIEKYIMTHADVSFTHGLCPDCLRKFYPEVADDVISDLTLQQEPPRQKPDPPAN